MDRTGKEPSPHGSTPTTKSSASDGMGNQENLPMHTSRPLSCWRFLPLYTFLYSIELTAYAYIVGAPYILYALIRNLWVLFTTMATEGLGLGLVAIPILLAVAAGWFVMLATCAFAFTRATLLPGTRTRPWSWRAWSLLAVLPMLRDLEFRSLSPAPSLEGMAEKGLIRTPNQNATATDPEPQYYDLARTDGSEKHAGSERTELSPCRLRRKVKAWEGKVISAVERCATWKFEESREVTKSRSHKVE
ncbi:Uu.00g096920.m01.CDS01 [Anthostomella pinea]|uniref:Uu.00g096920.m01.CDS01 n=1 Tax=Anthostomella pinea TaxID=933095 RepID=A0AAI8V795_9PEZI|nr:Uu.00g096920.m01.CDS01 [Anthostomella pinea]